MNMRRLVVGGVMGGAVLAGMAAPMAFAGPVPDATRCAVSGDESPAPGVEPGEGFAMYAAGDEATPFSCSYTAQAAHAGNYEITLLSRWELTVVRDGVTVHSASGGDTLANPVRLATGTYDAQAGDVVTLSGLPDCAPGTEQCGLAIAATVGSDPSV